MIDDRRKIIFVHCEKSAGTSVERAFDAKIVAGAPDAKRQEAWLIWQQQVLSAKQYKSIYAERWKTYRKIAVVRNPGDRLLSRHRYFLRADKAITEVARGSIDSHGVWPELLNADIRHQSRGSFGADNQQTKKIGPVTDYDYVLRCETLASDWEKMKKKLGVVDLPEIGHENSSGQRVNILDYVKQPHLRGKLAVGLRADLDAYHYKIGTVTVSEQRAILKAMSGACKGAGCDLLPFLKRVYPVAH